MQNNFTYKIISRYICLSVLAVILALSCFHGELYISGNGYLLLRNSLDFDSSLKDRYGYDNCYDVVVNGIQMYIIAYPKQEEMFPPFCRFTFLPEHFGIIEAAVSKTREKVSYELLDPFYLECYADKLDQIYGKLDMVMEFFGEHWSDDCSLTIDFEGIKTGRLTKAVTAIAVILTLQTVPLLVFTILKKEQSRKYQIVCYGILSLLQILVMFLNAFDYVTII